MYVIMKHFFLLLLITLSNIGSILARNHKYAHDGCQSPPDEVIKHPNSHSSKTDKPIIDSTAIKQWVSLGSNYDLSISNNGQYFAYSIQIWNKKKLVIQSTSGTWKKEFPDAVPGFFSRDSRQYYFQSKDTLYFLFLGTQKYKYITNIVDYSQPDAAKGEWLAWQSTNNPDELTLHNLLTGASDRYPSVAAFAFNRTGKGLLLKRSLRKDTTSNIELQLQLMRLPTKELITIWVSKDNHVSLNSFILDDSGAQACFMTQETGSSSTEELVDRPANTIWYYKKGMEIAIRKATSQSDGIPPGLHIQDAPYFSDDGRYIFLGLIAEQPKPKSNAVKVDVWHYADMEIQSLQLKDLQPQPYAAVINTESNKVICLQRENETSALPPKGDFMVFTKNTRGDRFWLQQKDSNWLVSLRDGSRTLLKTVGHCDFWFSPSGKYLVYSDAGQQGCYFSYNLKTDRTSNISATIPSGSLLSLNEFEPLLEKKIQAWLSFATGIGGWMEGDTGLLVYDNYDIWRLDLTGQKPPVNLTAGYGNSHQIKFRLTAEEDRELIIGGKKPLLLTAYNTKTKHNGFYQIDPNRAGNPNLLTMGPYVFSLQGAHLYTPNGVDFDQGLSPIKAADSDTWIIKRQSNIEAPNYFLTTDFLNFKPLTNLQPHKNYNWLTAELISFQQLDGTISQGVLYKPENFDPTKKYPVLFNYYEQLSHRLYQYPTPDFTKTNINVAWFVSRGYLVFTPDIYNNPANRGLSAYNTVVGAAQYLSRLSFVDAKKMAINGHSSGGGLTNYIITHTNLFAAAIEGAGVSDLISSSLQLSDGRSRLGAYDVYKGSFWENKDSWLKDSPIMKADNITTPLIIFHSKKDGAVPWEQAVELFIAMRRLGKRVWILQYDNGNHGVWGKDCEDYTIRITQFFDHYLKGTPPPMWMTRGLPARLKGVEDGLGFDPDYTTPMINPGTLSGPSSKLHK